MFVSNLIYPYPLKEGTAAPFGDRLVDALRGTTALLVIGRRVAGREGRERKKARVNEESTTSYEMAIIIYRAP